MNRPPIIRLSAVVVVAVSASLVTSAGAADAPTTDAVASAAAALAEHLDSHQSESSEATTAVEDADGAAAAIDEATAAHLHDEELAALSVLVAERVPDIDSEALLAAWTSTSDQRRRVVLAALSQTGDPYKFAAAGPDAFDCSGLSTYAWGTVGVELFHYSRRQIDDAAAIERTQLQPGDLVWRPGHVMIYLGVDDLIVNAVQPGKPVTIKRWGKVQRFGNPIHDPLPTIEDIPEP